MDEIKNKILEECVLCPHQCKVNRKNGELGRCGVGKKIKLALANLHFFEEPCISGVKGSGTVFFSGCNMNCKFCQNYKISQEVFGKEIEVEDLVNEFLSLQKQDAHNINLVTGVMYIPQIIEAIKLARKKGLILPIVYNSSGYENPEIIKMLDGYIDVYLPDFKYFDDKLAQELSGISNYVYYATETIKEMYNQVGSPEMDERGIIKKGLIVRHLVLPNHIENSKKVLKWIKENFENKILVSVMAQYFPTNKAMDCKDINRKLTEEEYQKIEEYIYELNLDGYMQDLEDNEEQYVPNFEQNYNKNI